MRNLRGWFKAGSVWKQNGRWLGLVKSSPRHVIFGKQYTNTPKPKIKVIFGQKYKQATPTPKEQVIFGQKYKQIAPTPKEQVVFGQDYNPQVPKPKERVIFGRRYENGRFI